MNNSARYLLTLIACLSLCISSRAQTWCPFNIDLEDSSFNGWELLNGTYVGSTLTLATGPAKNTRHTITSGTGLDPYGNFPVVSPTTGKHSLKLGNDSTGYGAEGARFILRVPANGPDTFLLNIHFAMVLQDPSHLQENQPRLLIRVYDTLGTPTICNQMNFISGPTLPDFIQTTVNPLVYYRPWDQTIMKLKGVRGKTMIVEFINTDCGLGAHFGYSYIDISCGSTNEQKLYCSNKPFTLKAPGGYASYEWIDSNTNVTVGYGKELTIPAPSNSTTYGVILTPHPLFGCKDTLYRRYTLEPMFVRADDAVICPGDSAVLKTTANDTGFTYSWTPASGLSCTNCANPKAAPTVNTTYTVTVTDARGCTASGQVKVTIDTTMFLPVAAEADTVCAYDTLGIRVLNSNIPSMSYIWTIVSGKGDIISGQGDTTIKTIWKSVGKNVVVLKRALNKCRWIDTIEIFTKYTPTSEFEIDKDRCTDEQTIMRPYKEDGAVYTWQIAEHNAPGSSYVAEIPLSWSTEGKKIIKQTVRKGGCQMTTEKNVAVHEYPAADISGNVAELCYGKEFKLSTQYGDRYTYGWTPPQYFNSNNLASVTGKAERSGYVHLSVSNTWGCISADSIYISAEPCCEMAFPDAFTPNNDGINDTYKPINVEVASIIQYMITNRWGQVIYNTKNLNDKWDGSYNGEPLGMDTYYYYIQYICNNGKTVEKKGNFILIR